MPVYNGMPYLKEALECVRLQTFRDFEMIIVDDLSKDDSFAFVQDFLPRAGFPLIHLRIPEKKGACPARVRNHAIRQARGAYLSFLDQDDIWLPERLECHHRAALAHPEAAIIHHDEIFFGPEGEMNGGKPRISGGGKYKPADVSGNCLATEFEGNFFGMSCVSLKRSVMEEMGPLDEEMFGTDDYELFLKVTAKYPVAYLDRVLTRYRVHGSNMSKDDVLMTVNLTKVLEKMVRTHPGAVDAGQVARRLYFLYNDLGDKFMNRNAPKEAYPWYFKAARTRPLSAGAWMRGSHAALRSALA